MKTKKIQHSVIDTFANIEHKFNDIMIQTNEAKINLNGDAILLEASETERPTYLSPTSKPSKRPPFISFDFNNSWYSFNGFKYLIYIISSNQLHKYYEDNHTRKTMSDAVLRSGKTLYRQGPCKLSMRHFIKHHTCNLVASKCIEIHKNTPHHWYKNRYI